MLVHGACAFFITILLCYIFVLKRGNRIYEDLINEQSNHLIIANSNGKILKINHLLMKKIWPNYHKNLCRTIKYLANFLNDDTCKKIVYLIQSDNFITNESFFSQEKNIIFYIKKMGKLFFIYINNNVVAKNAHVKLISDINDKNHNHFHAKVNNFLESCDDNVSEKIATDEQSDSSMFYKKNNQNYSLNYISNLYPQIHKNIWDIYFENNTIPYFLSDLKGNVVAINQAVSNSQFDGIKAHMQDSNMLLTDLVDQDSQDVVRDAWQDLRHNKLSSKKIKIHLRNVNNSLIVMHLQKINEQFILGSMVDITEQRNLELQFIHSQKMQAIGQLAGGIAHDFNNLLTAMIGFCDILLTKHFPGDESFTYITHIKQNVNRAANLVRQLLALSRQQVLQAKIFNPYVVIYELSFLIRRLIGEGIVLNIMGNEHVNNIKFDQGQLEQIIINLAINARDAMKHKGKLTIEIKNERIDDLNHPKLTMFSPAYEEKMQEGNYISINITDNGSGIDKKNLNKIFEPFFSTKGQSGTGLGLSTVYGIVKQANGFIFVDTKSNHGTKFAIFLKIYEKNEPEFLANDEEKNNKLTDITGSASILIIEDDDAVRMLMTNVLQNRGYTINAASSGKDALEIFNKNMFNIDLIVSDVIMPDYDGPKVVREIHQTNPKIKVVFISGYSKQYLSEQNIENENVYFLQKPFTMQDLIKMIKEIENK